MQVSTRAISQNQRNGVIGVALAGLLVAVVAFSAFGGSGTGSPRVEVAEGSFELFEGGEATFADFEGEPLVVNFWASWCPACVAELPEFQSVHEQLGDEVTFVGVANQDQRPASVQLAEEVGLTYQLADDPQGELFRSLDLIAMPSTLFIDAEGEILEVFGGQLDEAGLTERIETLRGAS